MHAAEPQLASFGNAGLAARQLKQSGGTIVFPGCTFLQDSEIARNQDYSSLYSALQATGVFATLANLTSPATLFAPTNEAFAEFLEASNYTTAEYMAALSTPLAVDLLNYHITPGAYMVSVCYPWCLQSLPQSLQSTIQLCKSLLPFPPLRFI